MTPPHSNGLIPTERNPAICVDRVPEYPECNPRADSSREAIRRDEQRGNLGEEGTWTRELGLTLSLRSGLRRAR